LTDTNETAPMDPNLRYVLDGLGNTYGPLGVAMAAAQLADPNVVAQELAGEEQPDTAARTFAGYHRELIASGLPRGLAENMVAEATASNRVLMKVHPDALAAVDKTRDKVLNGDKGKKAEAMASHPAGKQNPGPGPKVRKTLGGSPRSGPVVELNVYDDLSLATRRTLEGPPHIDVLRGRSRPTTPRCPPRGAPPDTRRRTSLSAPGSP
jgi:hypothetical protein